MISDLDRTLEKLFQLEFGAALPFDLSFSIPDKDFKTVSNAKNTLDCYLYDIRENRDLRSVEPLLKRNSDGTIEKDFPPARIKLSYCITAWSPAQPAPGAEPELDEHSLLSQVLAVLLKYPTLPAAALVGVLVGQEPPLPTTVVLPDSLNKAGSDFWNAIGGQLRPSLDYSVTIALPYQAPSTAPILTTLRIRIDDETYYSIGGVVREASATAQVIASAWVRVTETGQTYVTDAEGRFYIDRISSGTYTLTVRAVGFREGSRSVNVPQPDGLYDVSLTPL